MSDRTAKRSAGVTRITWDPQGLNYPPNLPDVDLTALTLPQLVRIARDRGLDSTGSEAEVRARVAADMTEYDVEA